MAQEYFLEYLNLILNCVIVSSTKEYQIDVNYYYKLKLRAIGIRVIH